MTILWSTDPSAAQTYHYAIGGQIQPVDSAQAVWRELAAQTREPLVVAGPDVDLQSVCELAERVRVELPEAGVLLLRRRLEVPVLAQALRAGIREVVVADDQSALSLACTRSLEISRRMAGAGTAQDRTGTIVTVFAAKGGCGKTTIATNLSARLAYDYVVVDTPPAFTEHTLAAFDIGDIAILLATPDIPAVKNLRLALNTLDLLGHPQDSRVVVLNRADAKVGLHLPDVVKAIRARIAASLPSSSAVPASINRGVPIVLDEPKH